MDRTKRVKFWGVLFMVFASIATMTVLVRSHRSRSPQVTEYGPIISITPSLTSAQNIGNTYARVAYQNETSGKTKLFKDSYGKTSIPSCVAFTDTEILVGQDALQQAHTNPKRTVCSVGRFLDSHWSSREVQAMVPSLPYQIVEGANDRVAVQMTIAGKIRTRPVSQLVGILAERLKTVAEADLGVKVTHAMAAMPPEFDLYNNDLMKQAAELAGMKLLRTLREPIAAAIAYQLDKVGDEHNIVVYDMGGESLRITAMVVDDGVFDVLDVVSLQVGGRHFDERVAEQLLKNFRKRNGVPTAEITADSMKRLLDGVETAKRQLSTQMSVRVEIPDLYQGLVLHDVVTRAKFEELNMDLFQSAIKSLQIVLDNTKLKPADIDDVIFIGGSSRIPKVIVYLSVARTIALVADILSQLRSQLEEFFGGKKPSTWADEAVITGLAMNAAVINGYYEHDTGCVVDVNPLSIGIETALDRFTLPVIPRHSVIPTRKTVNIRISKTSKIIKIIEGERLRAGDNRLIGELDVSSISPQGKADHLQLAMELDKPNERLVPLLPSDMPLIESILLDADKHWDIERPQLESYKALVDLEYFAEAVSKDARAKLALPKASRGEDESMRKVLAAADEALEFAHQGNTARYTSEQIADARSRLDKIVGELLVDDLASIEYEPTYLVGSKWAEDLKLLTATEARDEL
ncbi:hypothetical protein PG999_001572 [Apiospora kogelbergensis]|uniref:Uncharacterized protein n=1 Tax=Apiospora kogelbergensis TaxID=1337665 RepID=A0AAW0R5P6_9PEZI